MPSERILRRGSPVHRPPLFPSSSSAVERGLERRTLERLRHLGLDEKSPSAMNSGPNGFLRGQSDASVMVDLEKQAPRMLEVCAGRKKEDASELILTLPEARREPFRQAQGPELAEGQIEGSPAHRPPLVPSAASAVAMDLSPAYQGTVAETLPHAAVVFDKFHVSNCSARRWTK